MSAIVHSTRIVRGEYFAHIDGIRALAIVPVILFHMTSSFCPGGYAGVDVFFVISGYLITGGILRDLESGRFSLSEFYLRRIRRIFPAYFVCMGGVFLMACAIFYAEPLMRVGDALVAGTLFVANIYYRVIAGDYFAPELSTDPLAHLWSLSVEEQFYLIIPFVCAVCWKLGRRMLTFVLGALAIASLVIATHAVMLGNSNDAFYLLHFRAWEMLSGSLLATLPLRDKSEFNSSRAVMRSLAGIAGLITVLLSYVFLSSSTPFPGACATPPVLGTVLLIRFGDAGLIGSLLSRPLLVVIGRMSYSFYLWHWPVIVFWKYMTYDVVTAIDNCGILCLTIGLGYVSWRYIEIPVRTSNLWTRRRSFAFAGVVGTLFVAIGSACVQYKGWPTILHPQANEVAYMSFPREPFVIRMGAYALRYACTKAHVSMPLIESYDKHVAQRHRIFFASGADSEGTFGGPGEPQVLLAGDSHAGHLTCGLDVVLREHNRAGYCLSWGAGDMEVLKDSEIEAILKSARSLPNVTHVIISNYWCRERFQKSSGGKSDEGMFMRLELLVRELAEMGKTVVVTSDVPSYLHAPADIVARTQIVPPRDTELVDLYTAQPDDVYQQANGAINDRLAEVCHRAGGVFVPMHHAFLRGDRYVTAKTVEGQAIPLYRDKDHLSALGSSIAARFIEPFLFGN